MTFVPDTKDWTWVLDAPCGECGYVAESVSRTELGTAIRANLEVWSGVLTTPDIARRTEASTWSPLEYACHVRDVHRIFIERVNAMLVEESPTFANWDQDETALLEKYAEQDPSVVVTELLSAGEAVASIYDAVEGEAWARTGLRSNGSEFTVESIGRYHLHDVVHHAWDVRESVVDH